MTFTGEATYQDTPIYIVSLTGSSLATSNQNISKFQLSGNMTKESTTATPQDMGFSPNLSLAGTVDTSSSKHSHPAGISAQLSITSGLVTPSSELTSQKKYTFAVTGPSKAPLKSVQPHAAPNFTVQNFAAPGTATGTISGKTNAPASSNATQFSSLVSFTLSYGVNGGPNWTLSTFKGPGGGGSAGQLFNASQTHTDTLTITFVAACQKDGNFKEYDTYWQTIPKCDGTQEAVASAIGYQNNLLIQTFRGQ